MSTFAIVVGPVVGTHTTVVFPRAPPTCREVALAPSGAHGLVSRGPSGTWWSLRPVSRALPLPPPMLSRQLFCFLLHTLLVLARPRSLLPLFSSMTPTPRYVSPSRTTSVMGPPPAPPLSSQSTPRLPAPVASNPAFMSPQRLCAFPPPSTVGPSSCGGCRPHLLVDHLIVSLRLFVL